MLVRNSNSLKTTDNARENWVAPGIFRAGYRLTRALRQILVFFPRVRDSKWSRQARKVRQTLIRTIVFKSSRNSMWYCISAPAFPRPQSSARSDALWQPSISLAVAVRGSQHCRDSGTACPTRLPLNSRAGRVNPPRRQSRPDGASVLARRHPPPGARRLSPIAAHEAACPRRRPFSFQRQ